ncbi:MAG: hypothetical protein J2P19_04560 [Pseudonocardia sp.]|nr:hypothetical protein [Pseudonocardia sp.]
MADTVAPPTRVATAGAVAAVVTAHRYRYANEADLQAGIAAALRSAGYPVRREVPLSRRDRIDVLVDRVGVEVKLAGRLPDVTRQLARYARTGRVDELVLVTTRAEHRRCPDRLNGLPVQVAWLNQVIA